MYYSNITAIRFVLNIFAFKTNIRKNENTSSGFLRMAEVKKMTQNALLKKTYDTNPSNLWISIVILPFDMRDQ